MAVWSHAISLKALAPHQYLLLEWTIGLQVGIIWLLLLKGRLNLSGVLLGVDLRTDTIKYLFKSTKLCAGIYVLNYSRFNSHIIKEWGRKGGGSKRPLHGSYCPTQHWTEACKLISQTRFQYFLKWGLPRFVWKVMSDLRHFIYSKPWTRILV